MKMKIKKDLDRGEGTRLAPDAKLFDASADSHLAQSSSIALKKKELENDPRYRTKMQPGTVRDKFTSRKQADKETKPVRGPRNLWPSRSHGQVNRGSEGQIIVGNESQGPVDLWGCYEQVMPDCAEPTTMSMLGPVTCSAFTVIDPAFPPDELVC